MPCQSGYKFPGIQYYKTAPLGDVLTSPAAISGFIAKDNADNLDLSTISGNRFSAAAIKTDGTLWVWGCGDGGMLGTNSTVAQSSPVQTVSGGTNWKHVSATGGQTQQHMAAIKTDGTLWLWGCNGPTGGALGDNSITNRSSPVQTVSGGTDWKQVSVGYTQTAAIKTDGSLWTWGCGNFGRLGNNAVINQSSPVQTVSGGTDWKQVSVGNCAAAAIKIDGSLWLWGAGTGGKLGTNSTGNVSSPVQTVSGGTNWRRINLEGPASAAIKTDGSLWMWGSGANGSLGDNTGVSKSSPVQTVSGGTNWKQVSVDPIGGTVGALKDDGSLWIWGNDTCGVTGFDIEPIYYSSPVQALSGRTGWCQIAVTGQVSIFATDTPGQLYSWGLNAGKLGQNQTYNDTGLRCRSSDFDDVFVRKEFFSEGGLWGWGDNFEGGLGTNNTIFRSSPVQTISGGTNWKSVSVGGAASSTGAAIKTDGTLWMWGANVDGILGINAGCTACRSSPVQTVSGGTNWKSVSVGSSTVAAIKTDGTLWTWGRNSSGVLGDNTIVFKSSPVQTVSGGTNWKQVSAGSLNIAAIKTDGTLWIWGWGSAGRLGDNTTTDKSSPVQTVSGGTNWKQVSVGDIAGAIKTDGTLWMWGIGSDGRLATNDTISRSSPVQTVSGGTNWKQVRAGQYSAAIKTDGTLWTWGFNSDGRLGDNTRTNRSSPVQTVSGGTNWKQVDGSQAIKTDGTLWLWGSNGYGRLGDNSEINRSSPVQTISGGTNWKEVSGGNATFAIREDCW
jgi:alpha-tubulin suppressor-like RCC1 family protein